MQINSEKSVPNEDILAKMEHNIKLENVFYFAILFLKDNGCYFFVLQYSS